MHATSLAPPSPSFSADYAAASINILRILIRVRINDPNASEPAFLMKAKLKAVETEAWPSYSAVLLK